jgi:outer membrane protein assembly factor BamE (lipoprotein component of BamABCDE complex)
MIKSIPTRVFTWHRPARLLITILLAALALALAGCGSTKVYTTNKTIVYNGSLYNMGNVQRVGSRVEGVLPDGKAIDMRGKDKKAVNTLLGESSPIMVSTVFELDGQDLVYQRIRVAKYSEYSNMIKRFDRAQNDITRFMADKKKTQLKLK